MSSADGTDGNSWLKGDPGTFVRGDHRQID
jgi:hypothetical protein